MYNINKVKTVITVVLPSRLYNIKIHPRFALQSIKEVLQGNKSPSVPRSLISSPFIAYIHLAVDVVTNQKKCEKNSEKCHRSLTFLTLCALLWNFHNFFLLFYSSFS